MRRILLVDDDFHWYFILKRELKEVELHWLPSVHGMVDLHNTGIFDLTIIDVVGISMSNIENHTKDLKHKYVISSSIAPENIKNINFVLKEEIKEFVNG